MKDGLPERAGTAMGHLAVVDDRPGTFFYLTVGGDLFCSTDTGARWDGCDVRWPAATDDRVVVVAAGGPA